VIVYDVVSRVSAKKGSSFVRRINVGQVPSAGDGAGSSLVTLNTYPQGTGAQAVHYYFEPNLGAAYGLPEEQRGSSTENKVFFPDQPYRCVLSAIGVAQTGFALCYLMFESEDTFFNTLGWKQYATIPGLYLVVEDRNGAKMEFPLVASSVGGGGTAPALDTNLSCLVQVGLSTEAAAAYSSEEYMALWQSIWNDPDYATSGDYTGMVKFNLEFRN